MCYKLIQLWKLKNFDISKQINFGLEQWSTIKMGHSTVPNEVKGG